MSCISLNAHSDPSEASPSTNCVCTVRNEFGECSLLSCCLGCYGIYLLLGSTESGNKLVKKLVCLLIAELYVLESEYQIKVLLYSDDMILKYQIKYVSAIRIVLSNLY